jgi:hypothetical protein
MSKIITFPWLPREKAITLWIEEFEALFQRTDRPKPL